MINAEAAFRAPLEFPPGPAPYIEVGRRIDYELAAFGGSPPFRWEHSVGRTSGRPPLAIRKDSRGGEVSGSLPDHLATGRQRGP